MISFPRPLHSASRGQHGGNSTGGKQCITARIESQESCPLSSEPCPRDPIRAAGLPLREIPPPHPRIFALRVRACGSERRKKEIRKPRRLPVCIAHPPATFAYLLTFWRTRGFGKLLLYQRDERERVASADSVRSVAFDENGTNGLVWFGFGKGVRGAWWGEEKRARWLLLSCSFWDGTGSEVVEEVAGALA